MLNLQCRIDLLSQLGSYIGKADPEWLDLIHQASSHNPWFTPSFVGLATQAIADHFLQATALQQWADQYQIPVDRNQPKTVGIVMAGNIPLVGFHDWLAVFVSGHKSLVKLSSRDNILLPFLVNKLTSWNALVADHVSFAERLNGCDAYIATGSDNSARYFDYYFGKFPSIIRKNRTSVAVLDGTETAMELEKLADDTHLYFGLGCRNVTKIYVPEGYDFVPMLTAFRKYNAFFDHSKYRNNYDYQLALNLLNNKYYMTNGSVILVENEALFSPISELHYHYYRQDEDPTIKLQNNNSVQCIVGHRQIPFGKAQEPELTDYADGVDTMHFLAYL